MANSKVVAYMGTIRPAPIDDSGDYGDDESLRCYDFRDDQNYKDLKKAGFVTTQQRYREHGGKSSLLFRLN